MLRWLVGFDVPLWWAIVILWVCGSEWLLCGRCGLQFCVVIGVWYFYAVEIPVPNFAIQSNICCVYDGPTYLFLHCSRHTTGMSHLKIIN